MDHIDVDSVVNKLVKKILSSVLGLHKDQHWRLETLHDKWTHAVKFTSHMT